ncbi:MAG: hypothetical protein JXA13_07005, partial [Anaerolineales bacterium]|nr:hypothetical protein [Anaerolineales bacterium]
RIFLVKGTVWFLFSRDFFLFTPPAFLVPFGALCGRKTKDLVWELGVCSWLALELTYTPS